MEGLAPLENRLHEAQETSDDTHGEERQDDGDRGDVLLQELAAQQREAYGSQARDELVEVVLKRGDLDRIKGGATNRVVLSQCFLDAIGTTGVKEIDTQRWTRAPMMNIPRMEAPSVTLPSRPPERSLAMVVPTL